MKKKKDKEKIDLDMLDYPSICSSKEKKIREINTKADFPMFDKFVFEGD